MKLLVSLKLALVGVHLLTCPVLVPREILKTVQKFRNFRGNIGNKNQAVESWNFKNDT